MKRTGTILLAVVIGALQWAGTIVAQNAGQNEGLKQKNEELELQVKKLKTTIAELKAQLAATEKRAKESLDRAAKMAAEANKQKQQMMAIVQQMMVQRGGIRLGGAPAILQKQLQPVKKAPINVVSGSITKIDPEDETLVQINLGSKNDLKLGQKLSVVRRNPQPVYVGEVRIVELTPNTALGRVVVLPGRRVRPLETGDVVTNEPKSVKTK